MPASELPTTQAAQSPEARRREALPRRPVYTVALAGAEVRRRFRARVRLLFALGALLGLLTAWLTGLVAAGQAGPWSGPLLLAAGALLVLTGAARGRLARVQLVSQLLAFVALGAVLGVSAPPGDAAFSFLLHPSLLVGLPLLGSALVPGLLGRELPGWAELLLAAVWWVPAGVALAWLPAGEWILAGSGAAGLLLLFLLQLASQEAPPIYTPAQTARAAADVLPLALLGIGRRLAGRA